MIPAVSIRNLEKSYGDTVALKGVNISIGDGEFFGLLGPNGAGKTTTINILTGLVRKNKGETKIFGKDTIISLPMRNISSINFFGSLTTCSD